MLIIHGTARPADGARDALIDAATEMVAATRGTPGCLLYEFAASLDGESIINVEIWQDQASLDAHMLRDHTKTFLAAAGDLVDGEPVMTITEA